MKRISTLSNLAAIIIAPLACICFVIPSVQAQRVQTGLRSLSTQQLASQSAATQTKTDLDGKKSTHDQLEAIIERLDAINVDLGGKSEDMTTANRLTEYEQLEVIIHRLDDIGPNLKGKHQTTP